MKDGLGTFESLVTIVERLRSPGGCPWDREQTHGSLKRTLLEECYEVLEAIDSHDPAKLSEELGDILVQVVFHAQIAREVQEFAIEDVVTTVNQKLIRRHPHVFGDAKSSGSWEEGEGVTPSPPPMTSRDVERNWEKLKEQEGARKSPVEGIPKELPALAHAQLMQDRVSRVGFEWEEVSGVLDKVAEEVNEVMAATDDEQRARELGDLMFSVVNLARWLGIHAEDSLRRANARFQRRYTTMENLASDRGLDFAQLPLEDKETLWQEAKGMTDN